MVSWRRGGSAVGCLLVPAGLFLTGCSSTPPGGSSPTPSVAASSTVATPTPTASPSDTVSATPGGSASPSASATSSDAATPGATGSGSASPSGSSGDSSAVKRGSATGQSDVDVLVTLDYRNGAVQPDAPEVRIRQGDRIEVVVTSDKAVDIVVSGHPDDGADVDPGESEDIDFTITEAGTTTVTLRQPKVVLVSFVTGR